MCVLRFANFPSARPGSDNPARKIRSGEQYSNAISDLDPCYLTRSSVEEKLSAWPVFSVLHNFIPHFLFITYSRMTSNMIFRRARVSIKPVFHSRISPLLAKFFASEKFI